MLGMAPRLLPESRPVDELLLPMSPTEATRSAVPVRTSKTRRWPALCEPATGQFCGDLDSRIPIRCENLREVCPQFAAWNVCGVNVHVGVSSLDLGPKVERGHALHRAGEVVGADLTAGHQMIVGRKVTVEQ